MKTKIDEYTINRRRENRKFCVEVCEVEGRKKYTILEENNHKDSVTLGPYIYPEAVIDFVVKHKYELNNKSMLRFYLSMEKKVDNEVLED